jgi:hypothetical protein
MKTLSEKITLLKGIALTRLRAAGVTGEHPVRWEFFIDGLRAVCQDLDYEIVIYME